MAAATFFDCAQEASQHSAIQEEQHEVAAAKEAYLAEEQQRFVLPATQQKAFLNTVMDVFQAACLQLEHDHAGLIDADKENSRVLNNRCANLCKALLAALLSGNAQCHHFAHCARAGWNGRLCNEKLPTLRR